MYLSAGLSERYVLDEHGDRDVNFSLMYTTTGMEVNISLRTSVNQLYIYLGTVDDPGVHVHGV